MKLRAHGQTHQTHAPQYISRVVARSGLLGIGGSACRLMEGVLGLKQCWSDRRCLEPKQSTVVSHTAGELPGGADAYGSPRKGLESELFLQTHMGICIVGLQDTKEYARHVQHAPASRLNPSVFWSRLPRFGGVAEDGRNKLAAGASPAGRDSPGGPCSVILIPAG